MKPIYRVSIQRCRDGCRFDVEISVLGDRAVTPGYWLKNEPTARLWAAWTIGAEMWRSMRRWRNMRPYLL